MLKSFCVAMAMGTAGIANAASTVLGLGFTFVTDFDYPMYGYVTSGISNVNYSNAEFATGFAEFSLADVTAGGQDVLSFVLLSKGWTTGTYVGSPGGTFTLYGYTGTGVASKAAFTAPSIGTIGSFDLEKTDAATVLSFDVSSLVDKAIGSGAAYFGVHFSGLGYFSSIPYDEYASFGSQTLTVIPAIPEPSTFVLLGAGLGLVGLPRRRARARRQGIN